VSLAQFACGNPGNSFHGGLGENEDGSVQIHFSGNDEFFPVEMQPTPSKNGEVVMAVGDLTQTETELIKKYHKEQYDAVSFLVVNAETKKIIRSHLAEQPRILASVTKIMTALAALEKVKDVDIDEVSQMLKVSHNGLASKLVRKAAEAINGLVTPGKPFSAQSSCPSSTAAEYLAAHAVLKWLHGQIPDIDWRQGMLRDGAGCDYGNTMTALQMIYILENIDARGEKYDGKHFEDLMSTSGIDGTWGGRNSDDKGMVNAKTGTLAVASNLAGYFYVKRDGKLHKYYFSIFVQKRRGVDATLPARNLLEALVRNWLNQLEKQEVVLAGNI